MSEDKIAKIRARHSKRSEIDQSGCCRLDGFTFMGSLAQSQKDVATLLAEDDRQREENERLREAVRWYADPRNHFPVERRSPGDPDPAVVFVEEPPIMLDGGRRARSALEGKP